MATGTRAVLCTWHSLGPLGTHWPHISKITLLLAPSRGETPQEHEVQSQKCVTDYLQSREGRLTLGSPILK